MGLKLILAIILLAVVTFVFAIAESPDKNLHIISCDVGQGDATLVSRGNIQILVDGGPPNGKVIECLGEYLPFWDRSIELVVITHPQLDHFGGIIEVMQKYKVENLLVSGLDNSSEEYGVLKNVVGGSGARLLDPTNVSSIRFGLIYLDILHPKVDFFTFNSEEIETEGNFAVLGIRTSARDPNDFSIVAKLSLGEFDVLLTGDIGPGVTEEILQETEIGDVEYIKVPHHGSKNGLTKSLLDETTPEIAVISSGKANRFDHPHEEVLKLLRDEEIRILRTDELGNIEIVSDGTSYWISK